MGLFGISFDDSKFDAKTGRVIRCACNSGGGPRCRACRQEREYNGKKYAARDASNAKEDAAFAARSDLDQFEKDALRIGWKPSMGCFKGRSEYLCGNCPDCLRKISKAFEAYVLNSDGGIERIGAIHHEKGFIINIHDPSMWRTYPDGKWFETFEEAQKHARIVRNLEASELELKAAELRNQDAPRYKAPRQQYDEGEKQAQADPRPVICRHYNPKAWFTPCNKLNVATPNCEGLASKCKHWEG